MSYEPLGRLLADYSAGPHRPFHMPGHKRRALHTPDLPWKLDITEIYGFDDLHGPDGVLAAGMARTAALWGSDESYWLVNGSTGGILAALHAAVPRGAPLLVARNCHKSVYHALELLDLNPIFLQPEIDPELGAAGSLSASAVQAALSAHPEVKALVLVSPTYDGVLSDVASLCTLCHEQGIPVIVDEAHGAHLGFAPFPGGAVAAGADVVIQSLHKTLPSFTQTALLHRQGTLVSPDKLSRSLGVFQSSSPSYPLMASIDGCVRLLEKEKDSLFPNWMEGLSQFDRDISALQHLNILCHGRDTLSEHPLFFGFDPSKIVISTLAADLTGPALMACLREQFHIEAEMAAPNYVVAMTGLGTAAEDLSVLAHALLTIDSRLSASPKPPPPLTLPLPRRRLLPGQALEQDAEILPLGKAVGRIAAEYLWAYPPGIPLLLPGEEISMDFPDLCAGYEAAGIHLRHTGGTSADEIRVCR